MGILKANQFNIITNRGITPNASQDLREMKHSETHGGKERDERRESRPRANTDQGGSCWIHVHNCSKSLKSEYFEHMANVIISIINL